MKNKRKEDSMLEIISVLFMVLITLIITANAPSIHKSITVDNEPKYQQKNEKINNRKQSIKRLYKNAFNEKR